MLTRKLSVSAIQIRVYACLAILTALLPTTIFAQRGATLGRGAGRPHFVMGGPSIAMPPARSRSPHLPYQRSAGMQRVRGVARPMRSAFITMNRASNISSSRTFDRRFRRDRLRRASHFGIPATGFFPLGYGYWPWWSDSASGSSDCDADSGNCDEQPITDAGAFESGAEDAQRPMITVYLRDGSGYGALDYWVTNGVLHIATTYGAHKSFAMDDVDLVRTGKENAERGVSFTFQSYPMISDPGQVLAPDSYAPPCSEEAGLVGPKAAAGTSEKATEFGATGTATAKGLTLSAVRSGSRAEQIGLQAGDVLVRVDCKTIRSAQDVDMAFAGANRTVWVSYLIQGSWLTDKKVVR